MPLTKDVKKRGRQRDVKQRDVERDLFFASRADGKESPKMQS